MTSQDIEIRTIIEDEWDEWASSASRSFGSHPEPETNALMRGFAEIDRTLGAFHNGRIVGSATAHSFDMTVPGGRPPFSHVDGVTVQPTHRRRGLLNRLMKRQLADFRGRGDFVAGLTASESSIYSRFGYGIATWGEDWTTPPRTLKNVCCVHAVWGNSICRIRRDVPNLAQVI